MLKNTISTLCLLFLGNLLFAQTASPLAAANPDPIFQEVEKQASYPGGAAAIQKFVDENQRTLSTKRSEVNSTEVSLKFVVEKDGRVSKIQTISAPNVQLEEESYVLLRKMKWQPGENAGQAVRSYSTVTLHLNLN